MNRRLWVIFLWWTCAESQLIDAGSESKIGCPSPYEQVGNQCLFIDNTILGTWEKMTEYCSLFGGYLVEIRDADQLYHISHYLHANRLDDYSYWFGGNDIAEESEWVWASDGSSVERGTPFWGHSLNFQEPFGFQDENCGILSKYDFYYMNDISCDSLFAPICQLANSTTARLEVKREKANTTTGCPDPFEPVGNTCIHIDSDSELAWGEAQQMCQGLGGHLAKLDDADLYATFADYMQHSIGTQSSLWLGGTNSNYEDVWMWYDGPLMRMGTPYWDVISSDKQAPFGGSEMCLTVQRYGFFYFVDEGCRNWNGAVCQYDI